jgi:hypothetical protein
MLPYHENVLPYFFPGKKTSDTRYPGFAEYFKQAFPIKIDKTEDLLNFNDGKFSKKKVKMRKITDVVLHSCLWWHLEL